MYNCEDKSEKRTHFSCSWTEEMRRNAIFLLKKQARALDSEVDVPAGVVDGHSVDVFIGNRLEVLDVEGVFDRGDEGCLDLLLLQTFPVEALESR